MIVIIKKLSKISKKLSNETINFIYLISKNDF